MTFPDLAARMRRDDDTATLVTAIVDARLREYRLIPVPIAGDADWNARVAALNEDRLARLEIAAGVACVEAQALAGYSNQSLFDEMARRGFTSVDSTTFGQVADNSALGV